MVTFPGGPRMGIPAHMRGYAQNGGGVSNVIGGVTIGATGAPGSMYENFQLVWGDEFNTFTEWSAYNPAGRWAMLPPGTGGIRVSTSSWGFFTSATLRDWDGRSQGSLNLDPAYAVNSGVLALTNRVTTPAEKTALFQDYSTGRAGITSAVAEVVMHYLDSQPNVLLNAGGQWVLEVLCRPSDVAALIGYWFSPIWTAAVRGTGIVSQRGSTTTTQAWPQGGEVDVEGEKLTGTGAVRAQIAINAADTLGGANVNTKATGNPVSLVASPRRFVRVAMKKTATAIEFWSDQATENVMVKVGELTTAGRVEDIWGFHRILATNWVDEAGGEPWGGGAGFNAAQLPATNEIAWMRLWYPATRSDVIASATIAAVNLSHDATYSFTAPAVSALWSGRTDVDEMLGAMFDGPDGPGVTNTANGMPGAFGGGNATWNRTTRAFSWALPRDRGGRMWLQFRAMADAGRSGAVAIINHEVNVAPAPTGDLPSGPTIAYAGALSFAVPFTAFHSGNLSPHTISVSGLAGWMSVTGNGGQGTVTVSGTAPSSDSSTVLTITCTNRIGQTTSVTRTVTVQAAAAARWFEGNSAMAGWFLPDDEATITYGTGSQVSVIANKVAGGGNLTGAGTAASRVRQAAVINGRAVLRFTATGGGVDGSVVPKFLAAAAGRVSDVVVGEDTAHTYAIVCRPRSTATVFLATWGRTVDASNFQTKGLVRRNASASSVRAISTGTSVTDVNLTPNLNVDTNYVVVVRHNGATVDVWVNSLTASVTAAAQDVGSMATTNVFAIGASFAQSAVPDSFSGATADWDLAEAVVFEGALSNGDITSLINDVSAYWGITLS